jgi:ribosomal protein L18
MDKKQARLRRARKARAQIAELKMVRLTVYRTNSHIYAQIIDETGSKVLASLPLWKPKYALTFPMVAMWPLQP